MTSSLQVQLYSPQQLMCRTHMNHLYFTMSCPLTHPSVFFYAIPFKHTSLSSPHVINLSRTIFLSHTISTVRFGAVLSRGIPQGVDAWPPFSSFFTLSYFHCNYDDVHLDISKRSISITSHSTLTKCLTGIKSRMKSNFLQLNIDQSDQQSLPADPSSGPPTASPSLLTVHHSSFHPKLLNKL